MLAWTLTDYITQWIFVGIILACAVAHVIRQIITRRKNNKCNCCSLSDHCGKNTNSCDR